MIRLPTAKRKKRRIHNVKGGMVRQNIWQMQNKLTKSDGASVQQVQQLAAPWKWRLANSDAGTMCAPQRNRAHNGTGNLTAILHPTPQNCAMFLKNKNNSEAGQQYRWCYGPPCYRQWTDSMKKWSPSLEAMTYSAVTLYTEPKSWLLCSQQQGKGNWRDLKKALNYGKM